MAITTTESTNILKLLNGMFNLAPSAAIYNDVIATYEDLGNDFSLLASNLAQSSIYVSEYSGLSNSSKASKLLSNIGLTHGTTAGEVANDYFLERLAANVSIDQLTLEVLTYLIDDTVRDASFDDSAAVIKNKATVSQALIDSAKVTSTIEELNIISEVTSDLATVTEITDQFIPPEIESIFVESGNYTKDAIINVSVTFTKDVSIDGIDSILNLKIGNYEKIAIYDSKTSNSINYKYILEDGLGAVQSTISIIEDALVLNKTIIKDSLGSFANISNSVITNENAIIIDTTPPSIVIDSASYTANADRMLLYGSGFSSILEQSETFTADVSERFDFTQLIWDIDGDYDTATEVDDTPTVVNITFTSTDISLVKIISDTEISIILNNASVLESSTHYGHSTLGSEADTLDILTGFVKDTIGNISVDAIENNIILGIDNIFWGTSESNTIIGTNNADTMHGEEANDILNAMAGNDTVFGGDGDDMITGGLGIDTLTGGTGADTFVFKESTTDSIASFTSVEGIDTITDLVLDGAISDRLDLESTVSKVNAEVSGTADIFTFISDINTMLNKGNAGFDIFAKDISALIVRINDGELDGNSYIAVDTNADNFFTVEDFIVNVTGVTVINFNTNSFL